MKEEHGRLMFRWLIPFACAVIVILIMFFNFSVKIKEDAVDTVEDRLENAAEEYALQVNRDLEYVRIIGEHTARVIGLQKLADPESIKQLLESVAEVTEVQEVIYCDKDQNAIDYKGNSVDLSETDYVKILKNNSNLNYYFQKADNVTGSSVILIIIPIAENDCDLLLYYPLERFYEIAQINNDFDESAFVTMVTPDGNIFQSEDMESNFLKGENIWENIDQEYQENVTKTKVRMQNMYTGSVALSAGGEKKTLVYTPVGIADWVLIVGAGQTYVDYNQEYIFSKTIRMLYQLLSVMLLFIAIFAAVNLISRMRNAEKSRNLQERADTDLLTGLNNKLATERRIKEYMSQYPNKLAMMFIIDIDNFKKINDTMGHAFGDEVLRSFGKQIGANFRVTDIIGRTGGDEFTIFLKDLQKDENTLKEAQKLEYFFNNFQVGEYVKYSATASIGAAVFPEHGSDFESLYKSADQALYKAKRRGKNQIAFYDDRDIQKQIVQSVQ